MGAGEGMGAGWRVRGACASSVSRASRERIFESSRNCHATQRDEARRANDRERDAACHGPPATPRPAPPVSYLQLAVLRVELARLGLRRGEAVGELRCLTLLRGGRGAERLHALSESRDLHRTADAGSVGGAQVRWRPIPLGTIPLGMIPLGPIPLGAIPLGAIPPEWSAQRSLCADWRPFPPPCSPRPRASPRPPPTV